MEPGKNAASGPPKREFDDDGFETQESITKGMKYLKSIGHTGGYTAGAVQPKKKRRSADAKADANANLAALLAETARVATENVQKFNDAKRKKTEASASTSKPLQDGASAKEEGVKVYLKPRTPYEEKEIELEMMVENLERHTWVEVYMRAHDCSNIEARVMYNKYVRRLMKEFPMDDYKPFAFDDSMY
jgi:hypothetical protein